MAPRFFLSPFIFHLSSSRRVDRLRRPNPPGFRHSPASPAAAPERLDALRRERLAQILKHRFAPATQCRRKTAPEHPTHPLERALPAHVVDPLLRPVVLVAIALDGKTAGYLFEKAAAGGTLSGITLWSRK